MKDQKKERLQCEHNVLKLKYMATLPVWVLLPLSNGTSGSHNVLYIGELSRPAWALKEWWAPPFEPQAHLSQTILQESLCEDRLASPNLWPKGKRREKHPKGKKHCQ